MKNVITTLKSLKYGSVKDLIPLWVADIGFPAPEICQLQI